MRSSERREAGRSRRRAAPGPRAGLVAIYLFLADCLPAAETSGAEPVPSLFWTLPFVLLLLSIAVFPLIPALHRWWDRNSSKLAVAVGLGLVTCLYYALRGYGFHHSEPGARAVLSVLDHAVRIDYVPFIVLLFSLYTISGGIHVRGDIPAHPLTNVLLLGIGTLIASFVGTTGASMLLIRPLLQINTERRHVKHTVVFFIFLVSNIGGSLLPVGDPPLFLGYLRGVPFLWTLHLAPEWLFCSAVVLTVYWVIDHSLYLREPRRAVAEDERRREPIRVEGAFNLALLVGVVLAVGLLVPGRPLPGTSWVVPAIYLREGVQLGLAAVSLRVTSGSIRRANAFTFHPISEVACLFIGIFVTMQAPIEILRARGADLGVVDPLRYFWATGLLSSFLDNAPTYVVFFELAGSVTPAELEVGILRGLHTGTGVISVPLLKAISCGAVFMGAMTYIGNGPNFMVKAIAEQAGIRMPTFFGYLGYSLMMLGPVFVLVSLIFFV